MPVSVPGCLKRASSGEAPNISERLRERMHAIPPLFTVITRSAQPTSRDQKPDPRSDSDSFTPSTQEIPNRVHHYEYATFGFTNS